MQTGVRAKAARKAHLWPGAYALSLPVEDVLDEVVVAVLGELPPAAVLSVDVLVELASVEAAVDDGSPCPFRA
jgi:hypothetical protein